LRGVHSFVAVVCTAFIGVIIAYLQRASASSILKSHNDFQIRKFWIGLLYFLVGFLLLYFIVGAFIGYIDNVDPDEGQIVVSFDGRSVTYGFGELDIWCRPMPRPSIKARARNTPPQSSRS
jgi:hypothetical protein